MCKTSKCRIDLLSLSRSAIRLEEPGRLGSELLLKASWSVAGGCMGYSFPLIDLVGGGALAGMKAYNGAELEER